MAERKLIAAKAHLAQARQRMLDTTGELKHRLKPATLAADTWHGIKDKGSEVSSKGVRAVTERPGAAGGAVAAIALFLLRKPAAQLLTRLFGRGRDADGRVTADLTHSDEAFDLTAPVVATNKGV